MKIKLETINRFLSWFGFVLAIRPKTEKHPYTTLRIERLVTYTLRHAKGQKCE